MEELNRYFSKEDIQVVNSHGRRCSTLLMIRQLQIRTTPARMVIIKNKTKQAMTSFGEGVEKRKLSYTVGGNVDCVATMEGSMEIPQKS